jgi:hypothetical protein
MHQLTRLILTPGVVESLFDGRGNLDTIDENTETLKGKVTADEIVAANSPAQRILSKLVGNDVQLLEERELRPWNIVILVTVDVLIGDCKGKLRQDSAKTPNQLSTMTMTTTTTTRLLPNKIACNEISPFSYFASLSPLPISDEEMAVS